MIEEVWGVRVVIRVLTLSYLILEVSQNLLFRCQSIILFLERSNKGAFTMSLRDI